MTEGDFSRQRDAMEATSTSNHSWPCPGWRRRPNETSNRGRMRNGCGIKPTKSKESLGWGMYFFEPNWCQLRCGGWLVAPPTPMNILSWNCRGLKNPWTIHDLHLMVREKRPDGMFLCETKMEVSRLDSMRRCLGFLGCVGFNLIGRKGGLALLWRNQNEVEILNFFENHISAWVNNDLDNIRWLFSRFCREPETHCQLRT